MTACPTSLDQASARPAATSPAGTASPFDVPFHLHFLGGLVQRWPQFWLRLGRLEASLLAEELRSVSIQMPIYVCGLARSGSTLLHQVIASAPSVATHRIKDYPLLFTPYWWRRAARILRSQPPRERAHQDGVMITGDSPDALEEMLWMAFFPRCHDPSISNVLRAGEHYPAFESFYRLHLRKLLLAEGATRYAAKANYHVARLSYLVRLFPDARFLIPVRSPVAHIASLRRQQQRFSTAQRHRRRALLFMQRSGHFEFGLDRRPLNLGDSERVGRIRQLWAAGDEVRGLAAYWALVYDYLARLLAGDAPLRAAALVVRFETLCASPRETLRAALEHCRLPDPEKTVQRHLAGIRPAPDYTARFSARDLDAIHEETAATARAWGYAV